MYRGDQKNAGLSVRPWEGFVWLMQPEAQTTTHDSLAVSVGAFIIEIGMLFKAP